MDLTRTVWVTGIHGALTHGPLATGGGGKGQPAISTGGADMGTGTPIILTRGLGAAKFTLPPWAHKTAADIVKSKPGILVPYITSRPPALILVLAEVISILPTPAAAQVTPAEP